MDRQKYVAELGKLLSGMAPADREAVLRGINQRFDEGESDADVIAKLGSPTFAAVSVLRGYVPPEEDELAEQAQEPEPLPEPEPEPEPLPEPEPEPAADEAVPEPEPASEPEQAEEPETPEPEPGTEDGTDMADPVSETELEETADEAEPETEPEPESEDAGEPEPAGESAPEEAEPEPEGDGGDAPAAESLPEPETDEEEPPELPPFWDGPPELPRPPKAKVGLLIVYVFFGIVLGIPVTAALAAVALALLCAGALVIGAAALLVSFCFLGMSVVADILLLAGAGLVLAALGLLLVCVAIWFFRRCAVGFVDLLLRKGRDWCYERGEEERG